jgi:general secretion pathway protein F
LGVIIGMMVFVVPELTGIFSQNKTELPLLTRGLIATSNFFVNYGFVLLLVVIASIIGWKLFLKKPENMRRWDQTKLKLPVIGELIQQVDSSRFAATLSLLSASGVPLLQSLNIASQVMNNKIMQEASEQVANTVREGVSLSRALEQSQCFPPLLIQLVASGETNGTLPQQLDNAARDQERDLEMLLSVAMSLLEPATIIFMGSVVGLIVMAVLTPIFEMTKLAH